MFSLPASSLAARCVRVGNRSSRFTHRPKHATFIHTKPLFASLVSRPRHNRRQHHLPFPQFASFCTTKSSHSQPSILQLQPTGSILSLSLPIQSQTHLFTLSPNDSLKTFISSIKAESPSSTSVEVSSEDGGYFFSSDTPIQDVILQDFILSIDGDSFLVRVPSRSQVEGRAARVPLDIQNSPAFREIEEKLKERGKAAETMSVSEFLNWCEDLGMAKEEGKEMLKNLHELGVVLYFWEREELGNMLFLRPEQVIQRVEDVLALPKIQITQSERIQLLEQYRKELAGLEEKKGDLETRARRYANIVAVSGLAILVLQFVVFARLTWWDFSWDVVEPFTYFTTVVETSFLAYCYYLYAKDELNFVSFRDTLYLSRLRKLMDRSSFPEKRYHELLDKVKMVEKEIQLYKTESK